MSRIEAARYLSISPATFDKLVSEGKIQKGRQITVGRVVWDRIALDLFADHLPSNDREATDFETYLQSRRKK